MTRRRRKFSPQEEAVIRASEGALEKAGADLGDVVAEREAAFAVMFKFCAGCQNLEELAAEAHRYHAACLKDERTWDELSDDEKDPRRTQAAGIYIELLSFWSDK